MVINSIKVENFESHKNTVVKFHEGFNLVVGLSNRGKSSLIRAFRLVSEGTWSDDCVTVGAKFSRVTCKTNRGKVVVERGKGINRWKVTKEGKVYNYSNLGRNNVPKEVREVIGFGKTKVGGMSVGLNLVSQLEKHFLLAEIDGKSVKASTAAKIVDDLSGVGGVENLVDSIHKDRLACVSTTRELKEKIEQERGRKFDKKKLKDCSKLLAEIDELVNRIKRDEKTVDELEEVAQNLSSTKTKLRALKPRVTFGSGIVEAKKLLLTIEETIKKRSGIRELDSELSSVQRKLARIGKVADTEEFENAKLLFKEIERLNEKLSVFLSVAELKQEIATVQNHIDVCESRSSALSKQLATLVDNSDVCPFSGGKLFSDCKELIKDER